MCGYSKNKIVSCFQVIKKEKSIGSTGEMQQWNLTVVAVPASLGATRDSLPFYTAL